jgi:pyridoxine kinase
LLGFDVDFINSVQFSNQTGYKSFRGQRLDSKDLTDLYLGLKDNDLIDYTHILTGFIIYSIHFKFSFNIYFQIRLCWK